MASISCGIRLIVGLGNPGEEYKNTRHNVGFMLVDHLLNLLPKSFERSHAFQSYYWRGKYAGTALSLQKPLTFMNLSGDAVVPFMQKEEILPEEVLVVHDDMDIALGRIRIRRGGSSGGHNGINSLISRMGSDKFCRLRIGIGHGNKNEVIDYVLGSFHAEEQVVLQRVLKGAAEAVVLILHRGITTAMNRFNPCDWSVDPEIETEKPKEETSFHNKRKHLEVQS